MKKDVCKYFGQQVREHRARLGISQEELANRAGLHRTYVGGIERGERNPTLVNIAKLARVLGTTPAELLAELRR